MASKGQKFNRYTKDLRIEIVQRCVKGRSEYRLADEYSIPVATIKGWKRKYVNHPELYPNAGKGSGRLKESDLTKEDYKERYEILKKYQAFLKAQ